MQFNVEYQCRVDPHPFPTHPLHPPRTKSGHQRHYGKSEISQDNVAQDCSCRQQIFSHRLTWNKKVMTVQKQNPQFSKVPKRFRAWKAVYNPQTLSLQSCFIYILLIERKFPSYKKFQAHTSFCFEIQINSKWLQLRARKVSGAFEKQAPHLEVQTSLYSFHRCHLTSFA